MDDLMFLDNLYALFDTLNQPVLFILFACIIFYVVLIQTSKVVVNTLGRFGYLAFAGIGTAIHELSHFLMCLVFHHRVIAVSFFKPDPNSKTLGFVEHQYDTRSIYQLIGCFFIGTAPLVFGCICIALFNYLFATNGINATIDDIKVAAYNAEGIGSLFANTFSYLKPFALQVVDYFVQSPLQATLWLYLTSSVSMHMFPSSADMKNSITGAIALVALLYLVSLVFSDPTMYLNGINTTASLLVSNMFVAMAMSALLVIIFSLFSLFALSVRKLNTRAR